MNQILLLTKNIFIDTDWQTRLQRLGYEVFCSSQVLERVLFRRDFSMFSLFGTVIFSESITDEELAKIIEKAPIENTDYFRINEQELSERMENLEKQDSIRFINSQMTPTELREALADGKSIKILATFSQNRQSKPVKEVSVHAVASLLSALSRKERELFDLLYAQKGEFVARTELSTQLWQQNVSNSSLTQLSQIIGRLKKKMQKFNLDENLIITHWNKGYALDQELCESVELYQEDKVH
ncbi:winged helix-turn-helix domain-containing protein [Enterococcus sp. LJL90]